MAAFDSLPQPVRDALRDCIWDIHIMLRLNRDMDCTALVERIRAVKTEKDAIEFNRNHRR